MSSSDFYYAYKNSKRYYYTVNGTKVARGNIPVNIVNDVKEKYIDWEYEDLLKKIHTASLKEDLLNEKLKNIQASLAEAKRIKKELKKKAAAMKGRVPPSQKPTYNYNSPPQPQSQYQKPTYNPPPQPQPPPPQPPKIERSTFPLSDYKINSQETWRAWILYHHPDKKIIHPDIVPLDVFQSVMAEGRSRGW